MSVIDKKFNEICDAYAKFRNEQADIPEYFVLGMEARQAVKMQLHPDSIARFQEIKELFGVPVIPIEKTVIVK